MKSIDSHIRQYFFVRENPQIVWGFSVALAMKNKTPFDMTLKVFVSEKN